MVSLTDQRQLGKELGELMGSPVDGQSGCSRPSSPSRRFDPVVGKIAAICSKLDADCPATIDYFKSTATSTTFDGHMWHTRSVTNYFSPEERAKNRSH